MVFVNNYLLCEDDGDDDQNLKKDKEMEGFRKKDIERVEENLEEIISFNVFVFFVDVDE